MNLNLVTGAPIPIPELRMELHQPTIYELSLLGEDKFDFLVSLIKLTPEIFINEVMSNIAKKVKKEGLEEDLKETKESLKNTFTSNFEVFLYHMDEEKNKSIFNSFIYLLFPRVQTIDISFAEEEVVFKLDSGEYITVMEYQWEFLRNAIISIFSYGDKSKESSDLNPAGVEARKIAKKIEEARRKRLESRKAENSKTDWTQLGTMASIYSTASSIPITEVVKMTFSQLIIQLDRTKKFVEMQTIISSSALGLSKDVKIPDWLETV